MGNDFNHYPF